MGRVNPYLTHSFDKILSFPTLPFFFAANTNDSFSDMSVSLTLSPSPSPLLCPHYHTHFLELMDSPFLQNDATPFPSLFDPNNGVVSLDEEKEDPPPPRPPLPSQNDAARFPSLFEPHNCVISLEEEEKDPFLLALLSPPKTMSSKPPSLPTISITPSLLSQLDRKGVVLCAICKDEIAVDSEAKHLPCNHLYHSECITPWLELHSSCLLCRFWLSEEEEEEEEV